jgi:hypothetical protein
VATARVIGVGEVTQVLRAIAGQCRRREGSSRIVGSASRRRALGLHRLCFCHQSSQRVLDGGIRLEHRRSTAVRKYDGHGIGSYGRRLKGAPVNSAAYQIVLDGKHAVDRT